MLVRGREVTSINVIPAVGSDLNSDDPEWSVESINHSQEFKKLMKVKDSMNLVYETEFTNTLIDQAVNQSNRYKKVNHTKLEVGDIVLLKDPLLKANNYPMAVVKSVSQNFLGEVTDIEAFKGKTKELVRRHVASVVPLLKPSHNSDQATRDSYTEIPLHYNKPPKRKAAKISSLKTKEIFDTA